MPSFFLSLIWRDVLEVHFSDRDIFHRKPRWLINGYCQLVGCSLIYCLAEAGAYPQLPTQLFSNLIYYGHSELSREEKSKFEIEEKKFSLLLKREVCRRSCLENATFNNKLNFFPQIQILIFHRKTTQNDHNRLLYKFENDPKKCCVGSCGYAPASVKYVC